MIVMCELRVAGKWLRVATMIVMCQFRVAGKWLREAVTCVVSMYCDVFVLMLYYLFWVLDDVKIKNLTRRQN